MNNEIFSNIRTRITKVSIVDTEATGMLPLAHSLDHNQGVAGITAWHRFIDLTVAGALFSAVQRPLHIYDLGPTSC